MSAKLKWILVLCSLVILVGAAYVAYDRLAPMVNDLRTDSLSDADLSADTSDGSAESSVPAAAESSASDSISEESESVTMSPDFTLYDAEGNAVQFLDLIDKPTILNFWASTCGPCKSEMSHFQAAYDELGDQYNFIFVNYIDFYGETAADALDYLADNGYTFSTYFDTDHEGAGAYGIYSIPTTVFLSADGAILGGVQGAMSEEVLAYYIEKFFG